jgi:hypothetical protein
MASKQSISKYTELSKFTPAQFTATEFSTGEDKAKFCNQFVRFVESDFSFTLFPKWFYSRLSMTFGHIAHYNQHGFFNTWCERTYDKYSFLARIANHKPCGDPRYTYSDAERFIAEYVQDSGLVEKYQQQVASETETRERAQLAVLKAKYGE